jgi:hypothetical protein
MTSDVSSMLVESRRILLLVWKVLKFVAFLSSSRHGADGARCETESLRKFIVR